MDYKKLYEESQRKLQEEQRKLQEEQQRRLDEQRAAAQAERDTAAAIAALRAELEEKSRTQLGRTIDAYLVDIDGLNQYLRRLLPTPVSQSNTLSEGQKSQSTTSGRTAITGKYYPLKISPWVDFRNECGDAFERARAVIGDALQFPSVSAVRTATETVDEQLPTDFLESEYFRNEAKTSYLLHEALQRPAQRVLNAYLDAIGSHMRLYFDNLTSGWHVRISNTPSMAAPESSSSVHGDNENTASAEIVQKLPVKTQPDCLVLASRTTFAPVEAVEAVEAAEGQEEEEQEEESARRLVAVHRVVMGEHKPVHRIRAATVSLFNERPLPEDVMVQLAKAKNNTLPESQVGRGLRPGQTYFVNALSQTFHYMVTSGVEYGYLASGETLTFLKLSRDDPTTLLFHTEVFPRYRQATWDAHTGDIRDLPVAQLCGLTLLAYESNPESARQRSINVSQLAFFPELPPSLSSTSASSRASSPRGRRRRRDDDDDGSDNDDGDGDDRGRGSPFHGSRSSAHRLGSLTHQPRVSSPLKRQHTSSDAQQESEHRATSGSRTGYQDRKRRCIAAPSLPSPFDPSTFRPIRPYCTQACLRGLVRDEDVDYNCPNVLLHLEAQRQWARRSKGVNSHAITAEELREMVQYQLLENAELDCQCLLDEGARGAIGCLFKITVTGFGYTLVAKGVEKLYERRLRREMSIYSKLDAQQGQLIPVCLGMVKLLLPYPMVNCTLVTHMLLMSYAGEPLHWERLRRKLARRGIDVDAEEERTIQELYALGLVDDDEESNGNAMWCSETNRVMKIDFDQARVVGGVAAASAPVQQRASGQPRDTRSRDDAWREFRPRGLLPSTVNSLLLA